MKTRLLLFALISVVSLTSGCACCSNPCWGWRFHPCSSCGHGGHGAQTVPVSAPVVYRPVTVVPSGGPDCAGCGGGPMVPPAMAYPVPPAGGIPSFSGPATYPPMIGNPMPLPGANMGPAELHAPTPSKSGN
jgi:hypothetical protein